ncbi:hypothetical protein IAC76_05845 [Spirochaetes bacterium]|uniref:Uncharacterized protein n=1 Tax=Candidatus Scatousia excrementipullorum TaxID=2840936 RepID=A0A9D9DN27_9BACT|nr:hypothetical protein [Candidatus Scatousia excrementipullorum]
MIFTVFNTNANNQNKSFEENKKEVLHLFSSIERELTCENLRDEFAREKIFANYYISELKRFITDYYENKIEVQGLINYANNNNK